MSIKQVMPQKMLL